MMNSHSEISESSNCDSILVISDSSESFQKEDSQDKNNDKDKDKDKDNDKDKDKDKDKDNDKDKDKEMLSLSMEEKQIPYESLLIRKKNNSVPLKGNDDFKVLREMGFKSNVINKVYIYLEPNSMHQAISYMTKENNIIQHPYYRRGGEKGSLCFICGEEQYLHMDYGKRSLSEMLLHPLMRKKVQSNISNSNSNSNTNSKILPNEIEKKNIVQQEEFNCPICEESFSFNLYPKLNCGHKFCDECLFLFIVEKVKSAKVSLIQCPSCEMELKEDFIFQILNDNDELINKYIKFKRNLEIINDCNKKSCPYPNCDSYAEKNEDNKYVKCQNGHPFCFKCLKSWHGKYKCEEQIDKDFLKWKKGKKYIKKCPKCKFYVEKNYGCNHMTCAECGYQWCWLCKSTYTSNHFEFGSGCAGLQYTNRQMFQNCCFLWIYKFIVFTGFLLLYWIAGFPIATFRLIVFRFIARFRLNNGFYRCNIPDKTILAIFYIPFCLAYTVTYYILVLIPITISLLPILVYHPLLPLIIKLWNKANNQFKF